MSNDEKIPFDEDSEDFSSETRDLIENAERIDLSDDHPPDYVAQKERYYDDLSQPESSTTDTSTTNTNTNSSLNDSLNSDFSDFSSDSEVESESKPESLSWSFYDVSFNEKKEEDIPQLTEEEKEELTYQSEYQRGLQKKKTGFDSRWYWWKDGHRYIGSEFYDKITETIFKYKSWKNRWKYRKINHFTKEERRQFALHVFLKMIENLKWPIQKFSYPILPNGEVTIAEGLLIINDWKLKYGSTVKHVASNNKIAARLVVAYWDQARKPFGI